MPAGCHNHPDVIAHRRCYRCKRPLCSACAGISFHHYFCGSRCTLLFLLSVSYAAVKNFFQSGFSAGRVKAFLGNREYRSLFTVRRLGAAMFICFNLAALMALFLRTGSLNDQVSLLRSRIPRENAGYPDFSEKEPDSAPALDAAIPDVTVKNTISVSGTSSPDYVLVLYLNGRLSGAVPSAAGRFSFGNIRLAPGYNRVVVKAFAPDNTAYLVDEFSVLYNSPRIAALSKNTTRGDRSLRSVALTFDGGSADNSAPSILDVLRNEGVRTTIFLTGQFIRKYPDIVRQIAGDGHEVGNHTFSHPHLTTFAENRKHDTRPGITRELLQRELIKTDSLFYAVTGARMKKYWRAPFGEQNKTIRTWAAEIGYRHIGWTQNNGSGGNMDTRDWVSDESSELYLTGDEIRERLLAFERDDPHGANGAIILMHLGSDRKDDFAAQTLPAIIHDFTNRGYAVGTVTEILGGTAAAKK